MREVTTSLSPIQLAAVAALEAKLAEEAALVEQLRDVLLADTRGHLAALLGPDVDVAALTVADTDLDDERVVFTDGAVHLAVFSDGAVHLAGLVDGQWERQTPPLTTLAELGAALAEDG